jgi:hypothetical protein
MFFFNIPTVATNTGSFADRITDGKNGFLIAPDADKLTDKIQFLLSNKPLLNTIRTNLKNTPHKSIQQMIENYHQILTVKKPNENRLPSKFSKPERSIPCVYFPPLYPHYLYGSFLGKAGIISMPKYSTPDN